VSAPLPPRPLLSSLRTDTFDGDVWADAVEEEEEWIGQEQQLQQSYVDRCVPAPACIVCGRSCSRGVCVCGQRSPGPRRAGAAAADPDRAQARPGRLCPVCAAASSRGVGSDRGRVQAQDRVGSCCGRRAGRPRARAQHPHPVRLPARGCLACLTLGRCRPAPKESPWVRGAAPEQPDHQQHQHQHHQHADSDGVPADLDYVRPQARWGSHPR
jgi:hypothetical protein